jgi:hypothetical protein
MNAVLHIRANVSKNAAIEENTFLTSRYITSKKIAAAKTEIIIPAFKKSFTIILQAARTSGYPGPL